MLTESKVSLATVVVILCTGLSGCQQSTPPYPPPFDSASPACWVDGFVPTRDRLNLAVVGVRAPAGAPGLYVDIAARGIGAQRWSAILAGAVQERPNDFLRVVNTHDHVTVQMSPAQIRWQDTESGRRDRRPVFATAPQVEHSDFAGPWVPLDLSGDVGVRTFIVGTTRSMVVGSAIRVTPSGDWNSLLASPDPSLFDALETPMISWGGGDEFEVRPWR